MKNIALIISILISVSIWAQKPKDTLNTETIEVIKPYSPTISDAPKITDQPQSSTEVVPKQNIEYQINSVPVASTFTPNKGKAKMISQSAKEKLFDNYISAGMGNYTSPYLDGFVRFFPTRESEVGVAATHRSSKGNQDTEALKNGFSDTKAKVYYATEGRDYRWQADISGSRKAYHWYGLTDELTYTDAFLNDTSTQHTYNAIQLGGNFTMNDSYFKGGKVKIGTFFDNYKASEQSFQLEPELLFPLSDEWLKVTLEVNYLKGKAYKDFYEISTPEYTYSDIGLSPTFQVLRDDLSLNVGAKLVYASDIAEKKSEFRAYPNVDVAYRLDDAFSVFGGAVGGLWHNSYQKMATLNPYLSPTFRSVPTDEKYRFFGGVKGNYNNAVHYTLEVSYASLENQPLFQLNPIFFPYAVNMQDVNYKSGNSFTVLYDHAKKIGFDGEVAFDITEQFELGGTLAFEKFDFETQEEWNYPAISTRIFSTYREKKWQLGAQLFMLSDRKDVEYYYSTVPTFVPSEIKEVSVGTYLDLNADFTYRFSEQLSAFVRGNNLLTTQYQRYYNFPVLGLQVLGGLTYKFD